MNQVKLNAKYNIMQNFELSLQNIGYQIWNEDDRCDDTKSCPDNDGFKALTVGARYQFMPILIGAGYDINQMFAVKANFIISNGDLDGDYTAINGKVAIRF